MKENIAEIIRHKRDGGKLSEAQIVDFIRGVTNGSVMREQVSALTMAIFFQGMSTAETTNLTRAMANSGKRLNWSNILDGPVVDKHSTGGVGDKVSLFLAPMLAACGCFVPMISGRGLGHTGGTLDKLDSIPGYNWHPATDDFYKIVKEVGCAIIGQTKALAPADGVIYSVRDVTATVESIPLITASILAKKLCAGLEYLIMDIKHGSGAFMQNAQDAKNLGRSIIDTGNSLGLTTLALLSDMDAPLGRSAGNALEVTESVELLKNPSHADERLMEVTLGLASRVLSAAKNISNDQARKQLTESLTSGAALEKFAKMIAALGGPKDFCEKHASYLGEAKIIEPVLADKSGYLNKVNTRDLGLVVTALGGNRLRSDDAIDPLVGLANIAPIRKKIEKGDKICDIHADTADGAALAKSRVLELYEISEKALEDDPLIINCD